MNGVATGRRNLLNYASLREDGVVGPIINVTSRTVGSTIAGIAVIFHAVTSGDRMAGVVSFLISFVIIVGVLSHCR